MKKSRTLVLLFLNFLMASFMLWSCKTDPVEKAKIDFLKKIKGTWTLIGFTSSNSWSINVSGYQQSTFETSTYNDNIVTCTSIHEVYSYPEPSSDTTMTIYSYSKSLDFKGPSRDGNLYYTETTIKSGTSTIKKNSFYWGDLSIDDMIFIIENRNCKIVLENSDNIVITYDYYWWHISGGESSNIEWTFKKDK